MEVATRANRATCFHAGLLLGLFFDPEDGDDVTPKRWLPLIGLHGVISQKTVLFKLRKVHTNMYPEGLL
jgi:hypothetical protein